jgi:DNA-binding Xre family transcriptional regulator
LFFAVPQQQILQSARNTLTRGSKHVCFLAVFFGRKEFFMNPVMTKVRQVLFAKGLKQKDLAEKTGMAPTLVSLICSGRLRPSYGQIQRIARALRVPPENIFNMDE